MMKVISPLGGKTGKASVGAPRLDSLNGKTIGEMWNGDFKGNFTFPIIRDHIAERFEGVNFVPYTEFPYSTIRGTPAHQRDIDGEQFHRIRSAKTFDEIVKRFSPTFFRLNLNL